MNRGRFGLAFSAAAFTAAGVILLTPLVTAGASDVLCDQETATAGATVTYGAGGDGCTPLTVTYGDDFAPTASSARTMPRTFPANLAPCRGEDGPAPCRWNASSAGNGAGHSFWLDATACYHYLASKDAARWDDHGNGPCEDPYESSKPRRVRACQDQAAEGDEPRMAARFAACWIWPGR